MLPCSLVMDFRESSRQKPSLFYKLAAGVKYLAMISLLRPSPTLVLSTEKSNNASWWGMESEETGKLERSLIPIFGKPHHHWRARASPAPGVHNEKPWLLATRWEKGWFFTSIKANSPILESHEELRCFWKHGKGASLNLEPRKVFGELMQSVGRMSVFVKMPMEICGLWLHTVHWATVCSHWYRPWDTNQPHMFLQFSLVFSRKKWHCWAPSTATIWWPRDWASTEMGFVREHSQGKMGCEGYISVKYATKLMRTS